MIDIKELKPKEDIFDLGSHYIVVRNDEPITICWEGREFLQANVYLKGASNKDKMIVIFHKDAAELYTKDETVNGRFMGNREWREVIRGLEGKVQVVDTGYLWNNNFNTKMNPYELPGGGFITGQQFDSYLIEHIINDKRIGRGICSWCHKHSSIELGCSKGCDKRFFKPFEVNETIDHYVEYGL